MKKSAKQILLISGKYRWHGEEAYRAAISARATSPVNVAFIGNSITYGVDATDLEADSFASILRTELQSKYGNGGRGLVPSYFTGFYTYSEGWADSTLGGITSKMKGSDAIDRTITFSAYADNIDVYTVTGTSSKPFPFLISIDGGDFVQMADPGIDSTKSWKSNHSLGTLETHTIILKTTKSAFFDGVSFNVGSSNVRVSNVARSGIIVGTYLSGTYSKTWESQLDADLSIIQLTTNDYGAQTELATYEANLNELVDLCKATGSVILVVSPLQGVAEKTIKESEYSSIVKSIATAKGCGFISIPDQWGSYAQANAAGYMSDLLHPTDAGHAHIATILRKYIL